MGVFTFDSVIIERNLGNGRLKPVHTYFLRCPIWWKGDFSLTVNSTSMRLPFRVGFTVESARAQMKAFWNAPVDRP
jgi:hypothetical protein